MPNYADQFSQGNPNYNTGLVGQYLIPGTIHKLFLIPKDTNLTQAQLQTFVSTANAGISNNTQSSRWYPLGGNFTDMEDKSSDASIGTSGYGVPIYQRDGKYYVEFTYNRGGIQYHNMLRLLFHLQQDAYDVLILDRDTNTIMGTKSNTTGSVMKGYTLDLIEVPQYKFNNGQDIAKFRIGFAFQNIEEFNERFTSYQVPITENDLMQLNGLKNLEFQLYQALTAGVAKMRVTTGWGAIDLYSLYGSALATLTANWTFKDASNNTLTCTVATDATTNTLSFTFSGAAYTALASGAIITCTTPSISQMTATIPGYANASFTLTK